MIRDKIKSKEYFDKDIAYEQEQYGKSLDRLNSGKVIPSAMSLAKFGLSRRHHIILVDSFSRGDAVADLIPLLDRWLAAYAFFHEGRMQDEPCDRLQWVNLGWERYQEYLQLLSWAVLLNKDEQTLAKVEAFIDCRDPGACCRRGTANFIVGNNRGKDELLDLLLNTAGLPGPQADSLMEKGIYKKLLAVCYAAPEKRAGLMAKYLEGWYAGNKKSVWYGTDLRDDAGYTGYWSFESALVVRLFQIDDSSFAEHPHYPKDLARFAG